MDAVEFIKVRRRMYEKKCITKGLITDKPEDVVSEVEKWAKENPVKTRQSEFLKQWPNYMIDNNGVVGIYSRNVNNKRICNLEHFYDCHSCPVCRREFWLEEIE